MGWIQIENPSQEILDKLMDEEKDIEKGTGIEISKATKAAYFNRLVLEWKPNGNETEPELNYMFDYISASAFVERRKDNGKHRNQNKRKSKRTRR